MKKIIFALPIISLIPSIALANESKSGVYISAKMGASIMQMSGQFYPFSNFTTKIRNRVEGETHRTAVFGLGLAFGYDFYDNFNLPIRTELDFTSRENTKYSYSEIDSGSPNSTKITINNQIDLNTLMLNTYYDFKNSSDFTPYLSAGLGYAYISQKTSPLIQLKTVRGILWTHSHATNNFAWSAGAGIKYMVNQDFSFDLSYKYLDAGQAEVYNTSSSGIRGYSKTKVKTHDIMLSATYHF